MEGFSLLSFLDAPCLVIDPEGRVVCVNPAFERRFGSVGASVLGVELASFFEGGGREILLQAVADVCANGVSTRFRMREENRGLLGLASPIEAPDAPADRVGVVILLIDEPALDVDLQALQREIHEPLDEAIFCLEQLIEQTVGRSNEALRVAVERGMAAVVRAQKWSGELEDALNGRSGRDAVDARLDPVGLIHAVGARVSDALEEAGLGFDLLVPVQLPPARGDGNVLEAALVRLLRLRVATAAPGSALMLAARTMGAEGHRALLVTVVDRPRNAGEEDGEGLEPRSLCEAVAAYGGQVHTARIPQAGRATCLRLPLA
jgi:hypothetical protein